MENLYNGARAYKPVSERDSLRKAILKIKARRQGDLKSLKTSWVRFNDAFCDGLEWKTITVVGARPGVGKTLFMEQLVNDVITKLSMNTGSDYNTLMSKGKLIDKAIFQKCVDVYEKTEHTDVIDVIYDPCTVDEMCATLGGRAAEEVIFGKISTGALSDLEKITRQAYASIVYYGLNDKIGNVSYYDSSGQSEYSFNKPYSENTAKVIDEEVKKMIDIAYARTKAILMANKDKLTQLAEKLLEKEVIFKEDLEAIFGKRPFDKDIAEEKANELAASGLLPKSDEPTV